MEIMHTNKKTVLVARNINKNSITENSIGIKNLIFYRDLIRNLISLSFNQKIKNFDQKLFQINNFRP